MTTRLRDSLSAIRDKTVMVVGDVMLDDYVWGRAARISPEAPVMVLDAQRESQVPGGAANVAHNIASLGGRPVLVGVIGDDLTGRTLTEKLGDIGVGHEGLITDPGRTTTRKTRIIAHHQQVLRLDREEREEISAATADRLLETAFRLLGGADALLISDYRKGCLSEDRVRALVAAAHDTGKPSLANPKPPSLPWYAGVDLVSMNRSEAEGFIGGEEIETEDLIARSAERLRECGLRTGLITLGEDGMVLCGHETERIEALRVEVYDTAGAGDTVIAMMALGAGAGLPVAVAARVANLAAGCVVRHVGVAVANPDELLALAEAHRYSV
jgi:rfaE bifunctional protein kinase chain/domain